MRTTGGRVVRTAAAVIVVLALAGCGSGDGSTASPSPDDPTADARAADEPSPTATPTEYPHRSLTDALPSGRALLDGRRVLQSCLDLIRRCGDAEEVGTAFVVAARDRSGEDSIVVAVERDLDAVTPDPDACPDGDYERELVEIDERSYRPGERGTGERTEVAWDDWTGLRCDRQVTYLYREGEESDPTTRSRVHVSNGVHGLRVDATDADVAEQFARDYLDRLTSAG